MVKIIKKLLFLKIFMYVSFVLLVLPVLLSNNALAGNALSNDKVPTRTKTPIHSLQSNYAKVPLKQRYEFIFFYSATCQHCIDFCKTLKSYSVNRRIPVTAFKLTRDSSPYFPNSILVDQKTINRYFGTEEKEANIAVPVLFILNRANMHVYPVSRGNLTYFELTDRINNLTLKIQQFEQSEQSEGIKK